MAQHTTEHILEDLNLPRRDAYDLPASGKRFADGGQYRIEIPSCEGPRVMESVIAAAEKRLAGQGRLLVRASGTEPVIRVMGEGDDRDLVEDIVDSVVSAVGQAAAA